MFANFPLVIEKRDQRRKTSVVDRTICPKVLGASKNVHMSGGNLMITFAKGFLVSFAYRYNT